MFYCINRSILKFCIPLWVLIFGLTIPNNGFGAILPDNTFESMMSECTGISAPILISCKSNVFQNEPFTTCAVSIDFVEVSDCINENGYIDISLSGTSSEDFLTIEFLIDYELQFFNAIVTDGNWEGNFQLVGDTILYALAVAGNSESGCVFYYNQLIVLPTEPCLNEIQESLNLAFDSPQICIPVSAEVKLYQIGTTTLKHEFTIIYNEEIGAYQILDPPTGIFDTYVKPLGCIQQAYGQLDIQAGTQTLGLLNPIKGDLNNSNSINIVDVSIIAPAFNAIEGNLNFIPMADLNCSGGVNVLDISILGKSFGLEGDSPPVDVPED